MLETNYNEIFEFWIPGVSLSGDLGIDIYIYIHIKIQNIFWHSMFSGKK